MIEQLVPNKNLQTSPLHIRQTPCEKKLCLQWDCESLQTSNTLLFLCLHLRRWRRDWRRSCGWSVHPVARSVIRIHDTKSSAIAMFWRRCWRTWDDCCCWSIWVVFPFWLGFHLLSESCGLFEAIRWKNPWCAGIGTCENAKGK